MTDQTPLLTIKLEGANVESGRIALDDLAEIAKKLQICVTKVGQVLSGGQSNAAQGQVGDAVKKACKLDMIAISSGSVQLAIDLHQQQLPVVTLFGEDDPLGVASIKTFVQGISSLAAEEFFVPKEFDLGVLSSLNDFAKVLDRGYTDISLTCQHNTSGRVVADVNSTVRDRVERMFDPATITRLSIQGQLRELDFRRNSCEIVQPDGDVIICSFPDELKPAIEKFFNRTVEVEGEATMVKRRNRRYSIKDMEIERVLDPSTPPTATTSKRKLTARALLSSNIAGIWSDRDDITDDVEYARQLRQAAWQRRDNRT